MAEEGARSRDNGGEPGMEGAHTGPSGRDPMGAPDPGEYASGAEVEYDDDIDRDENDETTPTQSLRSSGKRGTHDWMLDGREIDFPRTRTNGAFRGTVGRRWSRPV